MNTFKKHPKIIRSVTVPQSLGFCCDIMIRMRDKGYEMVAVSSPGEQLDSLGDNDSFRCVAVPMERQISLVKDVVSLLKMISVLKKEKPQIIHSMTPKAGLLSMVAGWLTGVPVRVHTFTGLVWPTSTGLKRKVLMLTDKITCACATHIIPEGKGVMNDLINARITRKPMRVLGYGNIRGVDLERFNPARFSRMKSEKFVFLFVGRIVGDKGINELVEAFIRLNAEYPNTVLNLVGSFEPELDPLKPETLRLIKDCSAILANGPKRDDDLVREYVNADCFVFPSYREGFPNTVLEAGAMGLPCIVTDINGCNEIIEDGKNGIIIPYKDTKSLYEEMMHMYNDKEFRIQLSLSARQMIASRFDKAFVQKCQMDFYSEILG